MDNTDIVDELHSKWVNNPLTLDDSDERIEEYMNDLNTMFDDIFRGLKK